MKVAFTLLVSALTVIAAQTETTRATGIHDRLHKAAALKIISSQRANIPLNLRNFWRNS